MLAGIQTILIPTDAPMPWLHCSISSTDPHELLQQEAIKQLINNDPLKFSKQFTLELFLE